MSMTVLYRAFAITAILVLSLACGGEVTQPPTIEPAGLTVVDIDGTAGSLNASVYFDHADNETNINSYDVFFTDINRCYTASSPIFSTSDIYSSTSSQFNLNQAIPDSIYGLVVIANKNSGGSTVECVGEREGQYADIVDDGSLAPDSPPSELSVTKTTQQIAFNPLLESATMTLPSNLDNVNQVILYYWDEAGVPGGKLHSNSAPFEIARFEVTNAHAPSEIVTFDFADGILGKYPVGGIYACAKNYEKENCGSFDASYSLTGGMSFWDVIDLNLRNAGAAIEVSLAFENSSCPGADIATSCGNTVCDAGETADNCPSDCTDYSHASYNYQTLCQGTASGVVHPTNLQEIIGYVNQAKAEGRYVKAVSGALELAEDVVVQDTVGTASEFVCSKGVNPMVIGMDQVTDNATFPVEFAKSDIDGVDKDFLIRAPAGMRLHALGEWLHPYQKSLRYAHMGWADVSLGGNISNSAHGSAPGQRTVLAHRLKALTMVGADGLYHYYDADLNHHILTPDVMDASTIHGFQIASVQPNITEDTFKALRTSLGYVGVFVYLWFEVDDVSANPNLHVKVTFQEDADLFTASPLATPFYDAISSCHWGQYMWFPQQAHMPIGTYMKMCGNETNKPADIRAINKQLDPSVPESANAPAQELMQAGACQVDSNPEKHQSLMGFLGMWRYLQLVITPPLAKEIDGVHWSSGDVIGPIYQMQSSHLISHQTGFFQLDWEIAVPSKHIQAAANYTRQFVLDNNVQTPLVGIFVRFGLIENETLMAYTGPNSSNPTSGWVDGDPLAWFEMPIYVPVGLSDTQMAAYMANYEEWVTYLMVNFEGRPHWGKNKPWTFDTVMANNSFNASFISTFRDVVKTLDPNGLFSNPAGDGVLGLTYD